MIALNGIFMAWQEDSPFLNIKAPVQEAMNAVKKGTPKIGLEFLLGENGNYKYSWLPRQA